MPQAVEISSLERKVDALHSKLNQVMEFLVAMSAKEKSIGDWVHEKDVYRLTGLGRTTLYKLRKSGELSESNLVEGKGRFYRLSEIEERLSKRQRKGDTS